MSALNSFVFCNGPKPSGVTVCSRTVEFGRSMARGPRPLTHRPEFVALDWRNRRVGARWACGNHSGHAVLLAEPEPGAQMCRRCFTSAWPNFSVVYFARRADGAIKIGTTGNLDRRMDAVEGDLIGWQPGGIEVERTLHLVFADDLVPTLGRECFAPSERLMAYIARAAG